MKQQEFKELYPLMFREYPDILSIAQLQTMLGISRHLAYDLISNGSIHGIKIGKAYKVPKTSVVKYLLKEGVRNAKQTENH